MEAKVAYLENQLMATQTAIETLTNPIVTPNQIIPPPQQPSQFNNLQSNRSAGIKPSPKYKGRRPFEGNCFNCGEKGHTRSNCLSEKRETIRPTTVNNISAAKVDPDPHAIPIAPRYNIV